MSVLAAGTACARAQDRIFTIPTNTAVPNTTTAPARVSLRVICTYDKPLSQPLSYESLRPASVEAQQAVNTMLKKIGVRVTIPAYVGQVESAAAASAR